MTNALELRGETGVMAPVSIQHSFGGVTGALELRGETGVMAPVSIQHSLEGGPS